MKNAIKLLLGTCLAVTMAMTVNAAEKQAGMSEKMSAIDSYVRGVEKNASSLTRKEAKLSAEQMKKVTDENWTKIHTYSSGTELKRMKMYPAEGSTKTEEFYYQNGKPVFVFVEENGVKKENHDANAKGDKYYYADGKFVGAISSDGKEMDMKNADTKKMADKLKKESAAFRAAAK